MRNGQPSLLGTGLILRHSHQVRLQLGDWMCCSEKRPQQRFVSSSPTVASALMQLMPQLQHQHPGIQAGRGTGAYTLEAQLDVW